MKILIGAIIALIGYQFLQNAGGPSGLLPEPTYNQLMNNILNTYNTPQNVAKFASNFNENFLNTSDVENYLRTRFDTRGKLKGLKMALESGFLN